MVEIKARPNVAQTAQTAPAGGGIDLGHIPEVYLTDVNACLKRSGAARAVHDDIRKHVHGGTQLSRRDLEGMLKRAGVETTDVKTVLAYHCKEHRAAFSEGALQLMATMDWTDVAAAHVDELKRQNKEQVQGHRSFIEADHKSFETKRGDDVKKDSQKLTKTADEKSRLQQKTPLELEADFADEITKSGLQPSSTEAFMLLAHRKRFVSKD